MHSKTFHLLCAVIFLCSCQTYNQKLSEVHEAYEKGSYHQALTSLEESDVKNENSNKLLYLLEKGSILDSIGEYKQSRSTWLSAKSYADELYTLSLSKEAATYFINDSVQSYEGEDFEKVTLRTMLALSFLETQELDKAIVEARAINTTLRQITAEYNSENNHYTEDGFARFLAGMIYEAKGEHNHALIDYYKAYKIYSSPNYGNFFEGVENVPAPLSASLYQLALRFNRKDILKELKQKKNFIKTGLDQVGQAQKYGDIAFIHEIGQIAQKEAREFIFPFGDQIVRLSFPVIRRQTYIWNGRTGISVTLEGSHQIAPFAASNTSNMNAIAYQCLEDRRGRLVAKGLVRALAKGQMVDHATRQLGPLAGIAANIFTAVTETADTRSWTLLPEAFYVTRVRLPVGTHKIRVDSGGKLEGWRNIKIKPGRLQLFRAKNSRRSRHQTS